MSVFRCLYAHFGVTGHPCPVRIEIASWAICYAQNAVDLVLHSGVEGFELEGFCQLPFLSASSSGKKIVTKYMYLRSMVTLDALGYS